MVKVAFWDNQLCERGTTTALFDYAYYNIKCLNNESIVLYDKTNKTNSDEMVKRFMKHFTVYPVENFSEVDNILVHEGCDVLYIIKYGPVDDKLSKICKTVVHSVFVNQPHGDVYASVSTSTVKYNKSIPILPHIVQLPDVEGDLRDELCIPKDATVYGRYGGPYEFNIKHVKEAVFEFAKNNPNVYFIFASTYPFCDPLPNIIHMEKITDVERKVKFINTCDAMIHAREIGETFGLAIGEFSLKNKPVITTPTEYPAHTNILGNKAIIYNNYRDVMNILSTFDRYKVKEKDWNAYRDYTPQKVMKIFNELFLSDTKVKNADAVVDKIFQMRINNKHEQAINLGKYILEKENVSFNPDQLSKFIDEYFISAFYHDKSIAVKIAQYYAKLTRDNPEFYDIFKKNEKHIRSNFEFIGLDVFV